MKSGDRMRGEQGSLRMSRLVLVVNNDLTRLLHISIFLQRMKYQVFPVRSAEEALMIMDRTLPLLIITELVLPNMKGMDLVSTVKRDPRTEGVPVIIATTLMDPSMRQECEAAGCSGYLTYPLDHNKLYEAVQAATEATPRHYVRLAVALDVVVEDALAGTSGVRKEKVTAISEAGMYVATDNPIPYGTVTPFTLYLDREIAWGIRVEGKVLHSTKGTVPDKLPGMGVQFMLIRPEDREAIRTFVRKKLMEGIEEADAPAVRPG